MKPIFQFLIIGAFAYLVQQWIGSQDVIAVTPNKISLLKSQWETSTGLRANPARLKTVVDSYVEEEILFREALNANLHKHPRVKQRIVKTAEFLELDSPETDGEALFLTAIDAGLHKNDAVIRNMMISSVRNSISTNAESIALSEEKINQYYLDNIDRYIAQASLSFDHVFVSKNRNRNLNRSGNGKHKSEQLRLHKAFSSESSKSLAALGDPFIKGYSFSGLTMSDLAELMGAEFSKGVGQLSIGEWSQPIESAYGWHLVWVKEINPARVLSLAEAAHRVKRDLLKELQAQAFDTVLSEVKRGYTVSIEWPEKDSGNDMLDSPQLGLVESPELTMIEGSGSKHD
jgi:peptidyl-prolyl cis-trans isomerase C